ncbi:MAG: riboflavin synthase [Nitrospiraceae bacterium]|nr:riboflavin synthase [Nitrospiraceae bacterium]
MFTGIIQGLGTIKTVQHIGQGIVFNIQPDSPLRDLQEGESIAVSGVCLTATDISRGSFSMDVSPETLSRTTLAMLRAGGRVNLERAVRPSDRLGGHIVSGHVDGMGEVIEKRPLSQFTLFTIAIPKELDRYLIEKGSIAVDGISLTVNTCRTGSFSVAIIPHTAKTTTMGLRNLGNKVNIEVDLIGKYIEKLVLTGHSKAEKQTHIDIDLLARNGFL